MQKMTPDGPKWGQEDFFLLIQTLPTFWAERILILRIFIFWIFLGSQIFGLGPLGPHVGPPTLGPTWAHPLWAPRGPTHLGPTWAHPLWAQTPPPAPPPDEFSDPNLTPLPTHPGIKYVARTLAAMMSRYKSLPIQPCEVMPPAKYSLKTHRRCTVMQPPSQLCRKGNKI